MGVGSEFQLPVLRREALGILRSPRTFWLVVLSAAASSGIALVVWPRGTPTSTFANTAEAFAFAQLGFVLLSIPAVTAGAIAGEREAGTWDGLIGSKLSPVSVLTSKAFASAIFTLIVLVSSLPIFFAFQLLGGVSFHALLNSSLATFATAVTATLISLHASARSAQAAQAGFRSLAWIALFSVGVATLGAVLGFILGFGAVGAYFGAPAPTKRRQGLTRKKIRPPLAGIHRNSRRSPARSEPKPGTTSPVARIVLGYVAGAIVCKGVLWLQREGFPLSAIEVIHSEIATPDTAGGAALYITGTVLADWILCLALVRVIFAPNAVRQRVQPAGPAHSRWRYWTPERSFLALELLERRDRSGRVLGNPVFLKEIRGEFHGSARCFLWSCSGALFAMIITCMAASRTPKLAVEASAFAGGLMTCVLIAVVGSGAMSRELRTGNLDLLRGTRLASSEIVQGKLLSALFAGSGVATAVLLLFIPAMTVRADKDRITAAPAMLSACGDLLLLLLLLSSVAAWAGTAAIASAVIFGRGLASPLLANAAATLPFALVLFVPSLRPAEPGQQIFASAALLLAASVAWLMARLVFERLRWRDR